VAFAKGDLPGAKAAVTAALARNARDPGLLVEAVEIGQAAGDAQPAIDALLRAADAGETQGTVLNDAAWALLFVPGHEAQALTLAERAAAMKDTGDGTRHTLALAQLANGRPDDALATLQDAARRHGDVRYLAEYWWLIRGGLAEAYGLPDAAIAAYEKVPEEEGGFRFRSDVWAKTRLEALRATSGAQ
jgi:tetratricopeptide (TPR) repeat protein